MSWMSRHATEHKQNLLDTMPIDDKGDALLNTGYATMGTGPKAGAGPKETAYTKVIKKIPIEPVVEKGNYLKTVHEDKPISMTGSPLSKAYCAKSAGKSGCIKKVGSDWRVVSNKTGKLWPAKYGSQSKAEGALKAYHS